MKISLLSSDNENGVWGSQYALRHHFTCYIISAYLTSDLALLQSTTLRAATSQHRSAVDWCDPRMSVLTEPPRLPVRVLRHCFWSKLIIFRMIPLLRHLWKLTFQIILSTHNPHRSIAKRTTCTTHPNPNHSLPFVSASFASPPDWNVAIFCYLVGL